MLPGDSGDSEVLGRIGPDMGPGGLELVVRERPGGRILVAIVLPCNPSNGPLVDMKPSVRAPEAREGRSNQHVVAGQIEASPSALAKALDRWLSHMADRKKRPGSITAFRTTVERGILENGWTEVADLTFEAVIGHLGRLSDSGKWQASTYNRNLSAFRGFTRYMARAGLIAKDTLELAERADDDSDDGSRCGTLDEARAVIREAWLQDRSDRRSRSSRALYWMCLFAHGCRFGEPMRWRRRHVILEHPVPHVIWARDLQKSKRRQDVALCPELAQLLREHLARIDRERAAAGQPPAGPDDLVFPRSPNRETFRLDCHAAGVAPLDYARRPFTAHSARKFFSPAMTRAGVAEKMVDFLMRHRGRTEHRYYLPTLEEQAEAVAKLPRLWPDGECGQPVDNSKKAGFLDGDLTNGPRFDEDEPRRTTRAARDGSRPSAQKNVSRSRMGIPDLETENQAFLVADLFDSISRLLRQGATHDGPGEEESRGAG